MKNRKTKRKKVKCRKTRRKRNSGGQQPPPQQQPPETEETIECPSFDTLLPNKANYIWKTCVEMTDGFLEIFYITPKNIFGRTIETLIIPDYVCSVNGQITRCKIMIEDKYVARFVKIEGRWYAIMRLFGKSMNSGIFASVEKHKVYYLLRKGIEVDENTGIITLSPEHTRIKKTWVILSSGGGPTVELIGGDDVYMPIISSTLINGLVILDVLQYIRREEIFHSAMKQYHWNRVGKLTAINFNDYFFK
jgi:hypothetical protein